MAKVEVTPSNGRSFPEGSYAFLRGRRNSKRILALERKLRKQANRLDALEDDLEDMYEALGYFPIPPELGDDNEE